MIQCNTTEITKPGFSGSYSPSDCVFLLKLLSGAEAQALEITDLTKQEKDIQSGVAPYWTRVSREKAPSDEFLTLYRQALNANKARFAANLASMVKHLLATHTDAITIVSLARAGTPVGVLLKRALVECGLVDSIHYSVSIVRDKTIGLDENALAYICRQHDPESIIFVDGWTGKGGMTLQLEHSVAKFNHEHDTKVSSNLYVVSDLAGYAFCSGDYADYLLPFAMFNGIISGLVSRTVYNSTVTSATDFHAAYLLEHLTSYDLSCSFIEEIWQELRPLLKNLDTVAEANICGSEAPCRQELSKRTIALLLQRFEIADADLVKVGIGESTRAMSRRLPKALIVPDSLDADVQHLLKMAEQRGVTVVRDMPLYSGKAAVIVASANQ